MLPVRFPAGIPPVPVMLLLFKSKFPPNCGLVSATKFVSTTAQALSPLKKVVLLAVPEALSSGIPTAFAPISSIVIDPSTNFAAVILLSGISSAVTGTVAGLFHK